MTTAQQPATLALIPEDPPPDYRVGQADVNVINASGIVNQKPAGFISSYDSLINPYQGCTFGCSYCYASSFTFTRSAERSENWGNWVDVKQNAHTLVKNARPSLNGRTCYMASATDPYQPVELQANVTRAILESLAQYHPRVKLVIQTRSPFVTRDLDLLEEITQAGGKVQVNMTITTFHEPTRKAYERGCPSTQKRLDAIVQAAQAGIGACITMTPALDLGVSSPRDDATLQALQQAHEDGVPRFIFQPFHSQRQTGRENGAATRLQALDITRQLLQLHPDTPDDKVSIAYKGRYIDALRKIKPALEAAGAWVGTNRDGFRPPF